jgi:hypothetical protein
MSETMNLGESEKAKKIRRKWMYHYSLYSSYYKLWKEEVYG